MSKKRKRISLAVWLALILASLAGVVLTGSSAQNESIQEIMRDAVLHESNKLDLFGMEVNPGLISAFTVTGLLLLAALLIRIFVIPKFKYVPGKFQLLLEQLVGFFNGLGTSNSPHRHSFLNVYIFGAGVYIFFGTLFELFGLQAVTTHGLSISLPAPALGHKRSHCAGLSVLSRYPIGRHRCERAAGRRQNAEGFFASHIHELPSVRRAFKRAARNGIGLLLFEPELCAAGRGGRIVYPAARADPNLRADDAYLPSSTARYPRFIHQNPKKTNHKRKNSIKGENGRMKTMKACTRYFVLILALMMLFMAFATVAGAADGEEATAEAAQADSSGMKALAAAITVGLAAAPVQSGWALPSPNRSKAFPVSPKRKAKSAPL